MQTGSLVEWNGKILNGDWSGHPLQKDTVYIVEGLHPLNNEYVILDLTNACGYHVSILNELQPPGEVSLVELLQESCLV